MQNEKDMDAGRPSGLSSCGSSQQAVSPVPASIPDAIKRLERATWDSRVFPDKRDIATLLEAYKGNSSACRNCNGCEWVCENHLYQPWTGLAAVGCDCGAGAPCPVCNPLHASGILSLAADRIRALPEPDAGWNPHDEWWESGCSAGREEAIEAVLAAQAIEARRAETGTGSVHESAVGSADAPNSGRENSHAG